LLEENGHFAECGQNGLYYYWKSRNETCYPDSNSISKGLSRIFVRLMNPFISNYKEYKMENLTVADIGFDLGSKKMIMYPFKTLKISDDPHYEIGLGSSAVYDYEFNYAAIEQFIIDVTNDCKDREDLNVVNRMQLTNCVDGVVNKYNQQKQQDQPRLVLNCGNASLIDEYLETYQLCAESLDTDCYCSICRINKSKLTDEQNAEILVWESKLQAENIFGRTGHDLPA